MEVIFIKDLRNQGKKGEIKDVKKGYAENFLIKNGYAKPVNKENLRELDRENKKVAKEKESNIEKAKELKEKIEKVTLEFRVRTGNGDKVFGSISPKQIKEALKDKKIEIDKKMINLESSISSLGFHDVEINLYKDINAKVKVHVVK